MVSKAIGSKTTVPQGLQPRDAMRALYNIIDATGFGCILQVSASCKMVTLEGAYKSHTRGDESSVQQS